MFCILNVIIYCILTIQGFPGGSSGKESACNAEDLGSVPELGRSLEEGMATPPVFFPKQSPGQRNLAGCSPGGLKESDTTE